MADMSWDDTLALIEAEIATSGPVHYHLRGGDLRLISPGPNRGLVHIDLGVNLPATSTEYDAGRDPDDLVETLTIPATDGFGDPVELHLTFTPVAPESRRDPPSNTWVMQVADGLQGNAMIGAYRLVFDDSRARAGTLESVETLSGAGWDPVNGVLAFHLGDTRVLLDIGRLGAGDGLTQLSDSFAPVYTDSPVYPGGVTGHYAVETLVQGQFLSYFDELCRLPLSVDLGDEGAIVEAVAAALPPDAVLPGDAVLRSCLVLFGSEAGEVMVGDDGRQSFFGRRGADRLSGGADDDALDGGRGRDVLLGGAGEDTLHGGQGRDRLVGGAGRDRLTGDAGRDRLAGGTGDDSLRGGDGTDILRGGRGDDWIIGGRGSDTLLGGAGADVFVFGDADSRPGRPDRIEDFTPGEDRILFDVYDAEFNGYLFTDADHFAGTAFSANGPSIIATRVAGGMFVEADIDGDQVADIGIFVLGVAALDAGDFGL